MIKDVVAQIFVLYNWELVALEFTQVESCDQRCCSTYFWKIPDIGPNNFQLMLSGV